MVINHSLRWITRLKICIFRTSMQMMNGSVPVFRVLLLFLFFFITLAPFELMRWNHAHSITSKRFCRGKKTCTSRANAFQSRSNKCMPMFSHEQLLGDWLTDDVFGLVSALLPCSRYVESTVFVYFWKRVRREIFSKRSQAPVENMLNSLLTVVCGKEEQSTGLRQQIWTRKLWGEFRKKLLALLSTSRFLFYLFIIFLSS